MSRAGGRRKPAKLRDPATIKPDWVYPVCIARLYVPARVGANRPITMNGLRKQIAEGRLPGWQRPIGRYAWFVRGADLLAFIGTHDAEAEIRRQIVSLAESGLSDGAISHRLGGQKTTQAITKIRQRNGTPAGRSRQRAQTDTK